MIIRICRQIVNIINIPLNKSVQCYYQSVVGYLNEIMSSNILPIIDYIN